MCPGANNGPSFSPGVGVTYNYPPPLAAVRCCKSAPPYKVQSNIALPPVIYSNKANSVFCWTILRSFDFLIFVSFSNFCAYLLPNVERKGSTMHSGVFFHRN